MSPNPGSSMTVTFSRIQVIGIAIATVAAFVTPIMFIDTIYNRQVVNTDKILSLERRMDSVEVRMAKHEQNDVARGKDIDQLRYAICLKNKDVCPMFDNSITEP